MSQVKSVRLTTNNNKEVEYLRMRGFSLTLPCLYLFDIWTSSFLILHRLPWSLSQHPPCFDFLVCKLAPAFHVLQSVKGHISPFSWFQNPQFSHFALSPDYFDCRVGKADRESSLLMLKETKEWTTENWGWEQLGGETKQKTCSSQRKSLKSKLLPTVCIWQTAGMQKAKALKANMCRDTKTKANRFQKEKLFKATQYRNIFKAAVRQGCIGLYLGESEVWGQSLHKKEKGKSDSTT